MKIIGYILSGIALFLIGLSVFLTVREKDREKDKIARSTAKAREAKSLKAMERILQDQEETAKSDIQEISNLVTQNGTTKKETVND